MTVQISSISTPLGFAMFRLNSAVTRLGKLSRGENVFLPAFQKPIFNGQRLMASRRKGAFPTLTAGYFLSRPVKDTTRARHLTLSQHNHNAPLTHT
jgi:hypothetical protein